MEVLIAYLDGLGKCDITGTGLLLKSGNDIYVITCRHVIDQHLNKGTGQLVAIPNCKRYVFPKDLEKECILLTAPIYHPLDNTESADVAAFKVTVSNINLELTPYPLVTGEHIEPDVGSELSFVGFPVAYLERTHNSSDSTVLPPFRLSGVLGAAPLQSLRQVNFPLPVTNLKFATALTSKIKTLGLSGGPVYFKDKLVGLVVGEVEAKVTDTLTGQVMPVVGLAYTPISKIVQTLVRD